MLCAAGTYSLSTGLNVSCTACPAGGNCIAGGDVVTFAVGGWGVVDDKWVLESCPSGFAPNDAADACVECMAGTYSLRTGLDFACTACPAGGNCIAGGKVVTFAVGKWRVMDDEWTLQSCPSGFAPNDASDLCVVCASGTYSLRTGLGFDCTACPAGGVCGGGRDVFFAVGTWKVVQSVWQLISCPSGKTLGAQL